jgi:hypothetical protein
MNDEFLAADPPTKPMFAETHMAKQRGLLKHGLRQNSIWYLSVILLRISAVISSSNAKTAIWFDLSTAVSCFCVTDVERVRLGPPP